MTQIRSDKPVVHTWENFGFARFIYLPPHSRNKKILQVRESNLSNFRRKATRVLYIIVWIFVRNGWYLLPPQRINPVSKSFPNWPDQMQEYSKPLLIWKNCSWNKMIEVINNVIHLEISSTTPRSPRHIQTMKCAMAGSTLSGIPRLKPLKWKISLHQNQEEGPDPVPV